MVLRICVLLCSISWGNAQNAQYAQKPHIIMIVADDLVSVVIGWLTSLVYFPLYFALLCALTKDRLDKFVMKNTQF